MKRWKLYGAEALGLAIFMMSACFFSAMLEGSTSWHQAIPNAFIRNVLTGLLMGSTALIIFYLPLTAQSGSHINPAVTLTFLRLRRISLKDALAYMLAQVVGGTLAVFFTSFLLKDIIVVPSVRYAVTVPQKGIANAFAVEMIIGFLMMSMILHTSSHHYFKKYTRLFAASMVCIYVVIAGPISGFGMNPARSLASAIPSNIWTQFWIYVTAPVTSMLLAAEVYLFINRRKTRMTVGIVTDKTEKAA